MMGHLKCSTFEQNYLAKTTFVDTQSVILGLPQRKDLTTQMQQVGKRKRMPVELDPAATQRIEEDPQLKDIVQKRTKRRKELQEKYQTVANSSLKDRKDYKSIGDRERAVRAKLRVASIDMVPEDIWPPNLESETFGKPLPHDELYSQRQKIATEMFGCPQSSDKLGAWLSLIELCSSSRQQKTRASAKA